VQVYTQTYTQFGIKNITQMHKNRVHVVRKSTKLCYIAVPGFII